MKRQASQVMKHAAGNGDKPYMRQGHSASRVIADQVLQEPSIGAFALDIPESSAGADLALDIGQLPVSIAAKTNKSSPAPEDAGEAETWRVCVDLSVSVAIRSVRVNPLLVQTLECLERQSLQPDEVVIAIPADLTPDEQRRWKQLASQSPLAVRLVEGPRGIISQRENGIYAARTGFVLLLDDDIVLADTALEVLARTACERDAQCVVPYVPTAFPTGLYKWGAAIFLMEVPYAGSGGTKYLPNGGYRYPSSHLAPGECAETDGGIGWAILVNRCWILDHQCTGDYRLQFPDITYPFREDGAFTYSQKLAGAKMLVVNTGEVRHLGGTTKLDPRRLLWQYEAAMHNNCVYWYHYFFRYQRGPVTRTISALSLLWMLIGVHIMALVSSMQCKTLLPLQGLAQGYSKLIHLISQGASGHVDTIGHH